MILPITCLLPVIGGIFIASMKQDAAKRRAVCSALVVATDILLVFALRSRASVTVAVFAENVSMTFRLDGLGRLFAIVAAILYTAVCFYGYEYMQTEEREEIFYAFFFISFGAILSVAMSANLVTMYFCFELLTLTTVPHVLHELTKEAIAAGLKYLFYSIGGALMGLFAVIFIYSCTQGPADFVYGGFVDPKMAAASGTLFLAAIMAGLVGFGTKAGMYPMHGWLPTAHPIAPAPASALLSGIVAKAGVICVIRMIYYSVGPDLIRGTWVQTAWMCLAILTVFMGSMMAFREKIMKKRLAFSTISQISYIMLGLSLLSPEGVRGALLHLMQHAASKGCLFLVAGVFICKLGVRHVDGLKGIGARMPVTMWCFTIASLSLIGIPPLGGFLSKWVIASAALQSAPGVFAYPGPIVLLISALLTAGYLLPVTVDAFFPQITEEGRHGEAAEAVSADALERPAGKKHDAEPSLFMLIPLIALCAVTLAVGLFGTEIVSFFGF